MVFWFYYIVSAKKPWLMLTHETNIVPLVLMKTKAEAHSATPHDANVALLQLMQRCSYSCCT